jgi:hypothetical protein
MKPEDTRADVPAVEWRGLYVGIRDPGLPPPPNGLSAGYGEASGARGSGLEARRPSE